MYGLGAKKLLNSSPGPHETHPTGGQRVSGKTFIAVDDPDQVHDQDSQLLSGDGRRLRMENDTVPGTTTDKSKNEDPEAKRRVTNTPVQVQPQMRGGIIYLPGSLTRHLLFLARHLPVLRMTATLLELWIKMMRICPNSSLCCCPRERGRSLISKISCWQTKEDKHLVTERYRKEMHSLVEDTKAWVPGSREKSRLLRSSVSDRNLQPRPVLTLRPN